MNKKEVVSQLLDQKKEAILKVLLSSKEELSLQEIATKSKVPTTSTFRILQQLTTFQILQRREWKNSKVYKYNSQEQTEFLRSLLEEEVEGIDEFVRTVETTTNIQQIILHGGRKKGKANILLIGDNINLTLAEQAKNTLKEKGFDLSYLTLTKDQYDQMIKMGLYSGEKIVLK